MHLSRTAVPHGLAETVSTRWRHRLAGGGTGTGAEMELDTEAEERAHWRTRTAYYRAVAELLAGPRTDLPTWREIVATVRPRGSRSTFYDVTGRNARHALLADVLDLGTPAAHQLALCYLRRAAVEQLVDETKVWSYWPYRQGWLDQLDPGADSSAAESLVCVLAEWARRNPSLAEAVACAPPLCAVEDLVLLRRDRISPNRAFTILTRAVRAAVGPLAEVAGGVLATVRDDLGAGPPQPVDPDTLLVALAEQIYGVRAELRTMRPEQATAVYELATALVRDAEQLFVAYPDGGRR